MVLNKPITSGRYYLGGIVEIGKYFKIGSKDYGITAFQDIKPYNTRLDNTIEPYAYKGHNGVDLATPVGTPITATRDLKIYKIGYDSASGNYFYAKINGCDFFFCHLKSKPTKTSFKKGEVVAYTGDTGNVPPHLHIDKRKVGERVFYDIFGSLEFALYGTGTPPTATKTRIKAVKNGGTYYFDIKDKSKFDYSKKVNTQNVYDLADNVVA